MFRGSKVGVLLSVLVAALLFLCTQASANPVGSSFWRIEEIAEPILDNGNVGANVADVNLHVHFRVTNNHPTGNLWQFGVGVPDVVTDWGALSSSGWSGDLLNESGWVSNGFDSEYGAWGDVFPGHTQALWFVSDTEVSDLQSGQVAEYDAFGAERFWYDTPLQPSSPAVVSIWDPITHDSLGHYFGSTGANNPFPNPIPEPATMCLLSLGLVGLIVRRRRK